MLVISDAQAACFFCLEDLWHRPFFYRHVKSVSELIYLPVEFITPHPDRPLDSKAFVVPWAPFFGDHAIGPLTQDPLHLK